MHRNLACVIDKSSRGAKLERAFEELPYPSLSVLNVTGLETPESAMLSAVIFNALIIVALIPIALKGVHYKAWSAARLLKHNLLVYGLGGVIIPFAGIKLIDMVINVF